MAESFEAGPEGEEGDPKKAPESSEEKLEERPSEAPEQPEETPEKPPEEPEEKPETETVTGVVCANCGAPVKETQPNRYFCTEEKKFVPITTPGEGGGVERPSSEVIRESPTPNDILKRVLKLDPKLDDDQIDWIMDNTDVYGVLSTNDISSLIQDLNIKGAAKTARRVTRKYASALQHQLNNDPNLQREEKWKNLIYKESGYRPPSQGIEGNQMNVSAIPGQNQGQNPSLAPAIGPMGLNRSQSPQMGVPALTNRAQPQGRQNLNSQGHSQSPEQPLTERKLQKILDEREREQEEEKKERQMKEMISKQQELIENLNTRLTSLEKNPPTPTPRGGEGESKSEIRELKENVDDLNDIMESLGGENESSVPPELQATLGNINTKLDDLGSPSGEINEYDMEVKKAEHEASARKTEAEERRKGFKDVADAIRDTADNVGWSIGESVAKGGERRNPSQNPNPGQSQSNPQAQMQNQDYFEPKPVRKLDDGSRVLEGCPYKDCSRTEDIKVEEGKTTTTCPDCNRVLTVPAVE